MSRYLLKRVWGEVSDADMAENARRALVVRNDGLHDILWEHSHVAVDDEGNCVSYCVYQAPDAQRLLAHAEATGGHFVDEVLEIGGDVRPEDFSDGSHRTRRPSGDPPSGDPPVEPGRAAASTGRYLIVRRWRSLAAAEDHVDRMRVADAPDAVRWHHTHVSEDDSGRLTSFCVYEAPSADVLRDHIVPLGGFHLVGIYPIRSELAPDAVAAVPGRAH